MNERVEVRLEIVSSFLMETPSRTASRLPAPAGAGTMPLNWGKLKFNPVGLYDVRRLQGFLPAHPTVFKLYCDRFLAADIAWFAAGKHRDDLHDQRRDQFHPMYHDLLSHGMTPQEKAERKALVERVQALTFDLVRCLAFHTVILLT